MDVTIWGSRGSLPTPMPKEEYEQKLLALLQAYHDAGAPDDIAGFLAGREFPERSTYGGNSPCVEVVEDGFQIIFDAGSGIRPLGLKMMAGPCGAGEGEVNLFMSHFHWDHLMGFPFFVPGYRPGNKITVHSCHDGIKERFELQQVPTHFPVSLSQMPATKTFVQIEVGKPISIGPFNISTIKHYHPGDAYGYRIESKSGTLIYATDAEYTELSWEEREKHIDFFRDADVLIFDAAYSLVEAVEKLDWGHSSPFIGVEMADDANVKKLVLFHHDPTTREASVFEAMHKARKFHEQMPHKSPNLEIVSAYDMMELTI